MASPWYQNDLFDDAYDDVDDGYDDGSVEPHHVDVLRQSLHESYADADDLELEDALSQMFDTMSDAESFSFAKALNQIGAGAGRLLQDPMVASLARSTLPVAGGALGTVIGGPVGTAIGSQLGTRAAGALGGSARPMPAPVAQTPVAPAPVAPAAGGSAAAAQALVLSQQPQVLQSLLAAALGQHGRDQIAGVPVAQMLGMLSQVVGQAAADADELMYLGGGGGDDESAAPWLDPESERSLYTALLDADNLELADALDES